MLKSLLRLRPFIAPYRWRLSSGVAAFGLARLFEGLVPFFLAMGIDRIAAGDGNVTAPVLGIAAAVAARYVTVTAARYMVRTTGQRVAFDLRQSLYRDLQHQGARFFNRHSIGDMMTRAVADISLIQRLIAMGTILVIILAYATIVGFWLHALLLPGADPAAAAAHALHLLQRQASVPADGFRASMDVQNRLSDLAAQTQENLAGIRTIQAMAQEENEVARFAATNESYAGAFYRQAQINSLMTAWMPTLAAACSITILGYGGHLGAERRDDPRRPSGLLHVRQHGGAAVSGGRASSSIWCSGGRWPATACLRCSTSMRKCRTGPTGTAPAFIKGAIDIQWADAAPRRRVGTPALKERKPRVIRPGEMIAIMGRIGSAARPRC